MMTARGGKKKRGERGGRLVCFSLSPKTQRSESQEFNLVHSVGTMESDRSRTGLPCVCLHEHTHTHI